MWVLGLRQPSETLVCWVWPWTRQISAAAPVLLLTQPLSDVSLAGTLQCFWVSPRPSEGGLSAWSTNEDGEREGRVFIEKWGSAVPFLAKNCSRTKWACPSFLPQGFGLRRRLDHLTQDGQPLLQPSAPRLGNSGCLTGTGARGRPRKPTDVTF